MIGSGNRFNLSISYIFVLFLYLNSLYSLKTRGKLGVFSFYLLLYWLCFKLIFTLFFRRPWTKFRGFLGILGLIFSSKCTPARAKITFRLCKLIKTTPEIRFEISSEATCTKLTICLIEGPKSIIIKYRAIRGFIWIFLFNLYLFYLVDNLLLNLNFEGIF